METYKGHTYTGPIHALGALRAAVAELADLPDDTPIYRAEDDGNEPDSYAFLSEIEITFWDGETQCQADDEGAKKALFVW
ncbi:hypothetical protein [Streptosporangium canum]|uniref:hypothetical protein n=1 Tax=Streptosporangium canum TaxID=324952 RepID=UPI00379E0C2D